LPSFRQDLKAKGFKLTPQRSLILEIISGAAAHVINTEEIISQAREKQPQISASTVYRNLGILCQAGLIRRLNSVEDCCCYELNARHHHHLVCLKCHKVEVIDFCPINQEVQELADKIGFQMADHVFEIKGYCRDCAGA
jgi:Fe2+ or Zn2+ uptake regulation protein